MPYVSDQEYRQLTQGGGNSRSQKKHTGCELTTAKRGRNKGKEILVGWNYSKSRGMVSMVAGPYKGTKKTKSQSGRLWENWFVTLTFKKTGQEMKTSGMWDPQKRIMTIESMGWVANPNAPGKGYLGSFTKRRN